MFGNKKKNQDFSVSQDNIINGIEMQNPINVPNIYPMQQQNQPIQQNTQIPYRQQFQKQAKIIKAEINEDGEYYYIVVTNYPLRVDNCQLEN
jgi:hypothetical protein